MGKFSSLNSTYDSNFALVGGVINVNDDGILTMTDSKFLRNKASFGSVLTMFSSVEMSILDGFLLSENIAVIPDFGH